MCVWCLCIACAPHQVLNFSIAQQILGTHTEELELRLLKRFLFIKTIIKNLKSDLLKRKGCYFAVNSYR